MLIDDVTIEVTAGNGGNGAVAFSKIKNMRGPTGGRGGDGGNIYFRGISNLDALKQFRFKKEIHLGDGRDGGHRIKDGAKGKDTILDVPVGTVIHNLTKGRDYEIININETLLIAKGGRGGKGNFLFRSSTNVTPMEFQPGSPGQHFILRLELKFIADVGFIGLPNVGKSSLLNELTRAKSKVANYPFTTLEPNLGAYYDLILADIPGLIEGAFSGKGLGIKFLRHIERTKTLFHLVSAESENPAEDYKTIRNELGKYKKTLLDKPEYIFISKSDLVDEPGLKKKMASLKKFSRSITPISVYDSESIENVREILNNLAKQKYKTQ
jgi:GTP-binding protein